MTTRRLLLARVGVILLGPPVIIWTVLARLGQEARSAAYLAYLDAGDDIATMRRIWREGAP